MEETNRTMGQAAPYLSALCLLGMAAIASGQTPRELLEVKLGSLGKPAERNWAELKITDREIRIFEKIQDLPDLEAFNIAYKSEGLHITGILARPRLAPGRKYPLLILNHGGSVGVNGPFRAIAWAFARRGYVVLASTYRGEVNAEGQSEGNIESAKGEVTDVLELTRLGKQLPYLDRNRIGIMGISHGATITLYAIMKNNRDYKVAVAGVPAVFLLPEDINSQSRVTIKRVMARRYGRELTEQEVDAELHTRDMYKSIDNIKKTPLLLVTTDADYNYQPQTRFVRILKERGIEHHCLVYPDLYHAFLTVLPDESAGRRIAELEEWRRNEWKTIRARFEKPADQAHLVKHRDAAWGEIIAFLDRHLKPARSSASGR